MKMNNLPIFGITFYSKIWRLLVVSIFVFRGDSKLQENNADLVVSCDDSVMNVMMTFKYPFRGIVFIPEHYYDPTCSYGVSPNVTALQITLTLPHDSCKMRVLNSSNKLIGFNTITIFHHHMLETVYDYSQNITCELKQPIKDLNRNVWREPVLKSWISLENGPSVLPEDIVGEMGFEDSLLLVYHIKDRGINLDMLVMNCIGHDARTIDEKTRLYQISNPFGCSSESDLVSNFTVFRNPTGSADMIAFATIRNFSMVVRRRLHITCGAQICRNKCEHDCEEIVSKRLYFNDIVTKDLANRINGSTRPESLIDFERFDGQRRSHGDIDLHNEDELSESLLDKIKASSRYSGMEISNKTNEASEVNENDTMSLLPNSESRDRYKRAIKELKSELLTSGQNVIVIKSENTVDLKQTAVNILSTLESGSEISMLNSTESCEIGSVIKVKMTFEPTHDYRINRDENFERFNFTSFLRALIAIFALLCISGVCYSLLAFKRQGDTEYISDFATQSYI